MEIRYIPLKCVLCGREILCEIAAKKQNKLEKAVREKKPTIICKVCERIKLPLTSP